MPFHVVLPIACSTVACLRRYLTRIVPGWRRAPVSCIWVPLKHMISVAGTVSFLFAWHLYAMNQHCVPLINGSSLSRMLYLTFCYYYLTLLKWALWRSKMSFVTIYLYRRISLWEWHGNLIETRLLAFQPLTVVIVQIKSKQRLFRETISAWTIERTTLETFWLVKRYSHDYILYAAE